MNFPPFKLNHFMLLPALFFLLLSTLTEIKVWLFNQIGLFIFCCWVRNKKFSGLKQHHYLFCSQIFSLSWAWWQQLFCALLDAISGVSKAGDWNGHLSGVKRGSQLGLWENTYKKILSIWLVGTLTVGLGWLNSKEGASCERTRWFYDLASEAT